MTLFTWVDVVSPRREGAAWQATVWDDAGAGIEASFSARFGAFDLDVAFAAPPDGITALFGHSGCGKTTVLRFISGLDRLTQGSLKVAGEVWQGDGVFLQPHRRAVGYVFQEASLFPHLSVRGNLDYGRRRAASYSGAPDFETVVDMLGLERLLERDAAKLSGGERQRVTIGRALLSAPRLLLMDEPLAALDRASKDEILPYLERLSSALAIPVIYVSHDIAEVQRLAHYMVFMEHGRVRAEGPLNRVLSDLSLPFASTRQAGVIFDAEVIAYDSTYDMSGLRLPGGILQVPGRAGDIGTRQRLQIGALDVSLTKTVPQGSSITNVLPVDIVEARPLEKAQLTVLLRLSAARHSGLLLARITRKSWDLLDLKPGQSLYAQVKSVALSGRDRQ